MAEPAEYDGDPNRVVGFIQECEMYFIASQLNEFQMQIIFTLSNFISVIAIPCARFIYNRMLYAKVDNFTQS